MFNYDQALVQARKLARGEANADTATAATGFAPITLGEALDAYEADLKARGGSVYNASGPRGHLSPQLLAKPGRCSMPRSCVNGATACSTRVCSRPASSATARACAPRSPRRLARQAHPERRGMGSRAETLPDATVARNVILGDRDVSRLVAASYAHDAKLGLYVDVLATTGARPSQAARLLVEDLHGGAKPRLTMPKSAKGGSKNRAARKRERISLPITPALAAKLKQAAKGRPADAPLLLQDNGLSWGGSDDYREDIAGIVAALKLDARATLYALRHSSIVRHCCAACRSGWSPHHMTRACSRSRPRIPSTSPITRTTSRAPPCCIMSRSPTMSSRSGADHGAEA